MSETYAKKVWKDRAGGLHDKQEDAWAASCTHEIKVRMRTFYSADSLGVQDSRERRNRAAALTWFLEAPEGIIAEYRSICEQVKKDLSANP